MINNYSINQSYCYILIIPAFGIISTTISAFSNKSVFGQYGSLFRSIVWIMQQSICREAINCYINLILLGTKVMWNYIISFLVKILVIVANPQITKARSFFENYKPGITNFLGLSMLVGISEAIRLLPTVLIWFWFLINQKLGKNFLIVLLQYSIKLENGIFFMKNLKNSALTIDSSENNSAENTFNKNSFSATAKGPSVILHPQPKGGIKEKEDRFKEWVAGIIDGDGCFLVSKKGYASLEIITQLRDRRILYAIKQKYGGSVKLRGGDNFLRYRLHHKAGLLKLINDVNGLIRNPIRILQLGKICEIYDIKLKDPEPLTYYSGWLAGFFDTDGSIYLNEKAGQILITASQKNRYILDALVQLYGGTIYPLVKQDAFKWICFKKKEVLSLVNDYFRVNPCRSEKLTRLNMVNRFYELRGLRAHSASPNSDLGKAWKHYLVKWNSFLDKDIVTPPLEDNDSDEE